jgi:D-psicose/D-tagatose/L-ribulose 3-epimerase
MNQIGLHVGYWMGSGGDTDLFRMLDLTHEAGIDAFEVLPGLVLALSKADRLRLKKTIEDYGMVLSINGGLNETNDISSDDAAIRAIGIEHSKRVLEAAAEAGSDRWSGVNYSAWRRRPDRICDAKEKQRIMDLSTGSLRQIMPTAEGLGVRYCFEVVNRYEQFLFNTAAEGIAFCEAIGSPNAKLLIDVYHMNIEEDNMMDAIRLTAASGRLGHFHVGETNRRIPGSGRGQMPWVEIFATLKSISYQEYITMESFVLMGCQTALNVSVWRDLSHGADLRKLVEDARSGAQFVRSFLD